MSNKRINELLDLGLPLPYPAATICKLEDMGATVDLETGAIDYDGDCCTFKPTPAGEATAHLLRMEASGA